MSNVIGNSISVTFVDTNKTIEGKVDTGASTSSLHGEDIKVNGNRVSFKCPALTPNTITVDLDGEQQVKTADGGVGERPTIRLNVRINGVDLPNSTFNLNDRGHMDCPLLIGQNILKAGDFVIDVNKEESPVSEETQLFIQMPDNLQDGNMVNDSSSKEHDEQIKQAVDVLIKYNVSLTDMIRIASQ